MHRVQVLLPLLGSGTRSDPFHIGVPTFDGLEADYANGVASANVDVVDDAQLGVLRALGSGTRRVNSVELGDLTRVDRKKLIEVFAQTHKEWAGRQ